MVILLFLPFVYLGCGATAEDNLATNQFQPIEIEGQSEAAIKLSDAGLEFEIDQRSTSPIPGSDEEVLITIGDITRGRVEASLAWSDGEPILGPRFYKEGDRVDFTLKDFSFQLSFIDLNNQIIGTDTLVLRLSQIAREPAQTSQPLTEDGKIQRLIEIIEHQAGLIFIRNGKEYKGAEAATHLQKKWEYARDRINTAEDFIDALASESSMSGKPYIIRLSDGTEILSRDWLTHQLDEIEAGN